MNYKGIEFDAATHWAVLMYEADRIQPVEEEPDMSHWGKAAVAINKSIASFFRSRAKEIENDNL